VASAVILVFLGVNFIGAKAVGKTEIVIVGIKVVILIIFAVIGFFFMDIGRFATVDWPVTSNIFLAAGMIFISYQGFGLITNAAEDMENVKYTLPKALYTCIIIVIIIYLGVSLATIGNLAPVEIMAARDYALAEAARPFLGAVGFTVIAIAALFSTSSAINATLYGGANVSYIIAKEGELPSFFERKVWHGNREGLLITTGIVLLFVNLLDLEGIAMLASASFLLIYLAVNIAHLRLYKRTKANPYIIGAAAVGCLLSLIVLLYYTVTASPWTVIILILVIALSFVIEAVYRRFSKRVLRSKHRDRKGSKER
jgi:amino acid transporter